MDTPLTRLEDWPERLAAFMAANAARRFRWGRWDCAIFIDRAIEAECGRRPFADWTSGYGSRAAAWQRLADLGFETLEDALAARLPERAPARARRGDVVAVAGGEGQPALGICMGATLQVLGPRGLHAVPFGRHSRAFGVG